MSLPQHLWFRLALWCEARILPFRIGNRPMAEVLAIADGPVLPGLRGLAPASVARHVRRTTRRPWLMAKRPCLRQGVLAYRFLRAAGYEPELHFGVDRDSVAEPTLRAHCWVVLGRDVLLNPPDASMVTVLRHAGDRADGPVRALA